MKRLALLLLLGACTDRVLAPGVCPGFCPGGTIGIKDTILTDVIQRDSAFRGYVQAWQAEAMPIADVPSVVDSRAIFLMGAIPPRVVAKSGDTTTVPIAVDSARLRVVVVRRDPSSVNLRLKLYRLPITIDSTSTFAQLASAFSAPVVDSVNVSALLARPPISDTATLRIWGDTIRTDSAGHTLQISRSDSSLIVYFGLDTTRARFVVADSGKIAYGVRVAADARASAALGATDVFDRGPLIRWFYHYTVTATPDSVAHTSIQRGANFDSFVFDPPTPPLDNNLAVGGVPSARSLLRVAMPAFMHDSIDVVRATVVLVPVAPVQGAPGDSFSVIARPVLTDIGAKSPLSTASTVFGRTTIHIGAADTVRIELSDLVRAWALDTSATTTFMLGQVPEAASYTEIRFYSSRTPAFRPALHVTYVKRFPFGSP